MADQKPNPEMSAFEQLLIAAAVLGVTLAIVLWVLIEHQEDVSTVWKKGLGKVMQWLD